MKFIVVFLLLVINLFAVTNRDFSIYKKEAQTPSHTLLIIGGIHGDEPGAYFAPAFFEKYYKITKGSVWVIPNINGDSIIANQRGIYNDMNRKFSVIEKDDPDYFIIERVKKIILDKKVDLILNLHDGHGFYRETHENAIFNPKAWGQATIIDQDKINGLDKFGDLDKIATQVKNNLNKDKLFQEYHSFGVKNTQTKFKDEQMQLSLTYFAITNNKPAFAIETSKNITDLTEKVIYQLKSIEEFMKIMDIEFQRDFDINNYEEVKKRLFNFGEVKINENIAFDLSDSRKILRFVPLKKENNEFKFENSLGATKLVDNKYEVYIGNINVTNLFPQVFDIKEYKDSIKIEVDGKVINTKLGEVIDVKNSFKIVKNDFFRVNVIGFSKTGVDSEDDILLKKSDMVDSFSIDTNNKQYRVEFYKDNNFYGMITINFVD
ncbi:M99 family carboxypeptidase catalytic domain-containing protein [Aliarcobacter butzleri]|uniref:M99 family carboxypeptidase catalytic domain-containing protein n=1 Tax=Aliarcobacter butzleri TaxID=28197 RepID=A0AAW7QD15_9BACT|nr:M99 family carboxypeptidase catalytic domain-containing protein [Aliarcobacter butzleri]MDN5108006.1 M99 family carboxypeptidase catalytic domain-containing protein [Aliarcobacter butzleri]MDN5124222.1 M99 family carboxypeptidase catalytic domain-containing protein [Aliarcobacter butzleri]